MNVTRRGLLLSLPVFAAGAVLVARSRGSKGESMPASTAAPPERADRIVKTDAEWKKILTPEQYSITRKGGTERAFAGPYWDNHAKGIYDCVCCDLPLFDSATKFESGTGWPSFWAPIAKDAVKERSDRTFFMVRTEVRCARCDAHLGHVFDDGPKPTGLRYCMNGTALKFVPAK